MVIDPNLFLPKGQEGTIPQTIISSEAYLTVEEPHGEDLLVWQRMLEITKGKGWGTGEWSSYGNGLAKEIWEEHRTSNYTPYVITLVPSQQITDRIEMIEQALRTYPNHSMTSYFHSALASLYETQMWSQLALKNLAQAKNFNQKWQSHLRGIIQTSIDPSMRTHAEEESVTNWDRVFTAYKERQKPVDKKP